MNYPVNEIFQTIQGEATYTGTPAIFIRMQGCPVGCGWCDTKHTWEVDPEFKVEPIRMLIKRDDTLQYADMSVENIYAAIKDFDARHVVITGGEPCLYDLTSLTDFLIDKEYLVQIETSGTHEIICNDWTFVTVSPKIDMAGGFKILESAIARADEIKFPVGKSADIDKLIELITEMPPHPSTTIWLQPLSQNSKATKICVESAIKCGWRISIQTHKYMGVR
ncbi:NrdG Organic radical activating enzymes [uncultured Caudovirales phage]|uniref:NrdG Organic radical activating enzymes n=1 Tax=uncultured Caudovirales phage TaxID=2100421 RepID=A0A6J5LKC4_9CAUD|nr:NrdG Organic radical activating enzymes [uncultured Caudovirales phage]CAB4242149.1 NrdG Organic radical activating enzymes [uncultured Caudovirales phage]